MQKPADADKIVPSFAEPWAREAPVVLLFFLSFFLYVWLRIEPIAEYYSEGVVFFLSRAFLNQFLSYPGGLAEYGAAFLAQFNRQNWLGALVFSALSALLFLAARRLLRRAAGGAPLFVCLAPSLVLLAWRGRYDGHALAAGLALGLALWAVWICLPSRRFPPWLRWPVVWAIGAALYYVDGLWPYLLFLFLAAWFEAAPVRKWLNLAALALPALLIPACWHKFQIPEHALDPWGRGEPQLFSGLLFLLLPIGTVVLALLPQPRPPAEDLAPRPRHPQGARVRVSRARPQSPAWMKPALTLGSLLIGGALVWGVLDRAKKNLGQIEYYAAIKEPERVLALVSRLKTVTPEAEIRAQLALYHTGRLTQDLFVFANRGSGVLLPGTQLGLLACRSQIQTLLELGHVNEAEHQAAEAIESEGDRPDLLRALAHIYVLKDHPKAAAVFLNRLRQVPFQGDAAARWLAELEQNPRFTEDHDLDLVRSRMPTTDLPHGAMAAEVMLNQLLHTNPRNQMAFEYLMAQYLLDGDFKRLAQHAGQLDDFSYLAIPRHIEEALLLGQKLQGVEFDLHGRKIRPDTLRRFQGFCDALSGSAAQAPVALFALVPDFGDTFWYYYYLRLARRQASPG